MKGTGAIPAKVTVVKVDSAGAKAMTWSGQPVSDVLAAA